MLWGQSGLEGLGIHAVDRIVTDKEATKSYRGIIQHFEIGNKMYQKWYHHGRAEHCTIYGVQLYRQDR